MINFKNKKMKNKTKKLITCILFFLAMFFSGCGMEENEGGIVTPSQTTAYPDNGKSDGTGKNTENGKVSQPPEKDGYLDEINMKIIKDGVLIEDKSFGGLDEVEAVKILNEIAAEKNTEPVEPSYYKKDWLSINEGKTGYQLNVEKTLDKLFSAGKSEKIDAVFDEIEPEKTKEELESQIETVSSFETTILDKKKGRVNNLKLASKAINGTILEPGDTFSFFGTVGETSEENGYEKAPIITKDENGKPKKEDAHGGGICQISSTLYNAAEEAGFKIIERHSHSKDVGYVERGRDAAVNTGSKDLKFINTGNSAVMLKMSVDGEKVKAWVLKKK